MQKIADRGMLRYNRPNCYEARIADKGKMPFIHQGRCRMFRLWRLTVLSALVVLAFQSAFADLDPQANGLPGGLIIRRQAEDFDAMVRQTKPDFVWNGADMLWITHDASGKPGFTMDHAYMVELTGQSKKTCCLFSCDGYALAGGDGPEYPFTFESAAQSEKIAQDSKWGAVYQARWPSVGDMGSGCDRDTRNIFLLCDAKNQWHLLGDGPFANSHQNGSGDSTVETVKADVRWTGGAAHPAELSFTLLIARNWDWDPQTSFSMIIDCKLTTKPENKPFDEGDRGSFMVQGHHYVIADKSESLAAFAQKIARCAELDYRGIVADQRQKEIYRAVEMALIQIDPSLAGGVTAGAKIILPDKLFGPGYGDVRQW
ncbi:MAG: hypothetical protein ABSH22_20140 [Tepidisphaeraceae bacterium]|jgi:hypothetical protein